MYTLKFKSPKKQKTIDPFIHIELLKSKSKNLFIDPFTVKIKPVVRKKIVNPPKYLTYQQARKKYGISLSPLGDFDKDGVINMLDCRPFNPKMHKVPEKKKHYIVTAFFKPNRTWEDIWSEAEKKLPHAFKGPEEEYHSSLLEKALEERESLLSRTKGTPFKDVVGVYTIKNVPIGTEQTAIVQYFLKKYLSKYHPDKTFKFSKTDPSKADVVDINTKEVRKNVRISRYIPKNAPAYVKNLLTLLSPYSDITIVITDDPVDILRKSSVLKKIDQKYEKYLKKHFAWLSCETLARNMIYPDEDADRPLETYSYHVGPFHDISVGNAIAFFYKGSEPKGVPIGRVMLRWGTTHGLYTDNPKEKDIGIEYYPGNNYVPDEYHYKLGWVDDISARGFYGAFTADMAKSLIGYLQDILKKKGYHTKIIETPYRYKGFSDLYRRSGTRIKYGPLKRLKNKEPSQKEINDIIYESILLDPDKKIPKPIMYAMSDVGSLEHRINLAYRRDIPPEIQRKLSLDDDFGVVTNLSSNKGLSDEEAIKNIVSRKFLKPVINIVLYNSDKITPAVKEMIIDRIKIDTDLAIRLAEKIESIKDSDIQNAIINHKNTCVKNVLTRNVNLPEPVLDKLINMYTKSVNAENTSLLERILSYQWVTMTPRQLNKVLKFFEKATNFNTYDDLRLIRRFLRCINLSERLTLKLLEKPCCHISDTAEVDTLNSLFTSGKKLPSSVINYVVTHFKPKNYMRYINYISNYPLSDKALDKILEDSTEALKNRYVDMAPLFFYDKLFQNKFLSRRQKAKVIMKFIENANLGVGVSSDIIDDFLNIPEFYNFVKRNIKTNKALRRAVTKLHCIYSLNDNINYQDLFLQAYKYGSKEDKHNLYINPCVNEELKQIIKNEGSNYY